MRSWTAALAAMLAMTRNHMKDRGMLALGSCIAGVGILIAGLLALLLPAPQPAAMGPTGDRADADMPAAYRDDQRRARFHCRLVCGSS